MEARVGNIYMAVYKLLEHRNMCAKAMRRSTGMYSENHHSNPDNSILNSTEFYLRQPNICMY